MKRKLKGAPSAPSAPNYYHHCHVNQPLPFFDSFCLGTGHASKKNSNFNTKHAVSHWNCIEKLAAQHLTSSSMGLWWAMSMAPPASPSRKLSLFFWAEINRDVTGRLFWGDASGLIKWDIKGVSKETHIYKVPYIFSRSIVVFRRFLLAALPWHFDLQRNQDLWNFTALHGSTGFIHVPIETLQGRTVYLLENSWLKFGTRGIELWWTSLTWMIGKWLSNSVGWY